MSDLQAEVLGIACLLNGHPTPGLFAQLILMINAVIMLIQWPKEESQMLHLDTEVSVFS